MPLVLGGPGLGTLRTGAVVKPTPVASKQAAPNKTTQAKQTVLRQTTPVKAVVAPDPYAKALAAQPSLATLLAQASTQANTLAQQQVNAQVQAIQQQQAQAHATAAAQAAEINKASLAAAQFLTPLGDQAAGDYTAAVQNLGGLVGGYTGGLRDTAQAAQDAAQAQLAGISGNTQTVEGHGADLANLLYGVSGSIPANALATQGLGATALARAIPQQELSYGQQQAIAQIGAGNTAADALNTQLATARGQLPTLTSQYLTQFQTSARDVANQAHQRLMDANTLRNTTSEIAARAATTKAKTQPILDIGRSRLTGVLTDQFGHEIYKTVGGKQFRQATPGFHFDNTGQAVADPKPVTLDQMAALSARFTSVNHYKSDWRGNPLHGKITPVGGWVVSPDGQSAVPPTKPGKAFVPKVDKLLSASAKALVYIGEDGQPHFFKQADGVTNFPYDPTKSVALQAKNSGGVWVVFDPNTGKWSSAHDDSGVPLPAGTPKTPPAVHYGKPYPGENGNYWNTDPTTGIPFDTGRKAPASAIAQGTWSNSSPDRNGVIWQTNSKTGEVRQTKIPGRVPSQSTGTWSSYLGPNGNRWRINSKTNAKIDTGQKWATSGGGSSLTPDQERTHTARIDTALEGMVTGKHPDGTSAPKLTRSQAIDELIKEGYFSSPELKQIAMDRLNEYYPRRVTVRSKGPLGVTATSPG